jgi:type II secretory pathway pseudopilin PulG
MSMHPNDRRGFALVTVMLVVIIVAVLATSAAILGSAHTLGNKYYNRQSQLDAVSIEGLEVARARVNGKKSLYPADGYATLEDGVQVTGADGSTIPGVKRWTYIGPTGATSGQYGVFGSIVSVAKDDGGGVAIRRSQVFQESFAKYAYFTDIEPSNISFGGGDQIWGPVHSNDYLKIYSSGATFHDEARTAKSVQGGQYGTFKKGYVEHVTPIAMPETADLNKLQSQAAAGSTAFTTTSPAGQGQANLRIEFMAIDLNGDGKVTGDNEGFFRVYRSNNAQWLVADMLTGGTTPMRSSLNCGHYHGHTFVPAAAHGTSGTDKWQVALSNGSRRCYLGGSDSLSGGFVANDGNGSWVQWPGPVSPLLAGRPDAQYLFPMSRALNPNFKGVIYVDGKVVISGVLRGRVTLASTNNIIIGDDVTYATDPAVGSCVDILGLFSANDIVVADNTLNAPFSPASGYSEYTYDDTKDEFIHAIVLALDIFTVEHYDQGSTDAERCENENWGRGCLYLTGGIIQETRGAVGTILSSGTGGTGYVKRYAYDKCGASSPPPYFPTTGHFARGQRYWVDPVGFEIGSYLQMLTAGS